MGREKMEFSAAALRLRKDILKNSPESSATIFKCVDEIKAIVAKYGNEGKIAAALASMEITSGLLD